MAAQQHPVTQSLVYAMTDQDYEHQMEAMLHRSILHINSPTAPPEMLLLVKSEPASPPHSPRTTAASKSDVASRRSPSPLLPYA